MNRQAQHLVEAARRRHDDALRRAEQALMDLTRQHQPVTFVEVARSAGVSTDFLYRQPALRAKISSLRTRRDPRPAETALPQNDSPSAAVRALSARIKELQGRHRAEVADLHRALAAAHGENLKLRRMLDPR